MVIALSTGACYDLSFNQKQAINFVKKYSMLNGIELVFATPKDLIEFEINQKEIDFIANLSFKSIHMSFHDIEYKNDSLTKKLISKASNLSKSIVHGDLNLDNTLVYQGRINAIIDFGDSHTGFTVTYPMIFICDEIITQKSLNYKKISLFLK